MLARLSIWEKALKRVRVESNVLGSPINSSESFAVKSRVLEIDKGLFDFIKYNGFFHGIIHCGMYYFDSSMNVTFGKKSVNKFLVMIGFTSLSEISLK
ncbi:hypothetical protein PGLA_07570 [Paenibacillus glacialis]|uniref:Uncharacterized protein n=1 Tax=Paenibacillus glacialis TaxID=494026 RepID=A0A168MCE0_9BACL|nr:hypothetical protein PGLA_07570 [Paenibacillus glacialis]